MGISDKYSRELGSGGDVIAKKIAKKLDGPCWTTTDFRCRAIIWLMFEAELEQVDERKPV